MRYNVLSVKPIDGFRLWLRFADGKEGIYDMSPLLDSGIFRRIGDPAMFERAKVVGISVEWPCGVDIAPEELYENCIEDKAGVA